MKFLRIYFETTTIRGCGETIHNEHPATARGDIENMHRDYMHPCTCCGLHYPLRPWPRRSEALQQRSDARACVTRSPGGDTVQPRRCAA